MTRILKVLRSFKRSTVLAHYLLAILEGIVLTRCVRPDDNQQETLSCDSSDYLIAVRSAFYARLSVNTPGFCDWPARNNHRGDCVPHADTDRDDVANTCNMHDSCVLYTYLSYDDVVSSCSNVTGQVYFHVDFECRSRESALYSQSFAFFGP